MATLLSVNVGMPIDVSWRGRTVRTGVWKSPVTGPRMVRRLNIDGDGQGDLAGHGGEQRPYSSIKSSPTVTGRTSSGGTTWDAAPSGRTSRSRASATTRLHR